jgi:hypothetical protein
MMSWSNPVSRPCQGTTDFRKRDGDRHHALPKARGDLGWESPILAGERLPGSSAFAPVHLPSTKPAALVMQTARARAGCRRIHEAAENTSPRKSNQYAPCPSPSSIRSPQTCAEAKSVSRSVNIPHNIVLVIASCMHMPHRIPSPPKKRWPVVHAYSPSWP